MDVNACAPDGQLANLLSVLVVLLLMFGFVSSVLLIYILDELRLIYRNLILK